MECCVFDRKVRCDAKGCDLNYYSFLGIDQLCLVYFAEIICARAIGGFAFFSVEFPQKSKMTCRYESY